jgi:hypothetical protein
MPIESDVSLAAKAETAGAAISAVESIRNILWDLNPVFGIYFTPRDYYDALWR